MADEIVPPDEKTAKRLERMRQYYKDNKEKIRAYQLLYYKENKTKVAAGNRQWAQENKEKMRAYRSKWQEANPEKARDAINRWREQNSERERATQRLWNEENKERRNAVIHQWQQENRDKVRAARRRWGQNHPDRARANHAKRRSRKLKQMPAWVVIAELKEVYKNCPPQMHVDHIVPLRGVTAEGYKVSGLHVPWNLQYLTESDNCEKYNRMREEDHAVADAPVPSQPQLSL